MEIADGSELTEITSQVEYNDYVMGELTLLERDAVVPEPVIPKTPTQPVMAVQLPKLSCPTFDGSGKDKLEFKNFLAQFQNCIEACGSLSDANKLTYLRSYLAGNAFKLINHLSVTDDNFEIALDLLKDEYLDIAHIVDESFKVLLTASPSFDVAFDGLRTYVNECHSIMSVINT